MACTSALKSSSRSSFLDLYGNYSILGITKNNLFAATDCPKFKVTNLKCNGREKSIEQCSYTLKYASCSDLNEAAGVACKRHSGRGVTSQVSVLLGGKDHYQGDIMALNEQLVLGPVCDVGFGYNEVINVSDVSDRSGLPRKCKEFYFTHCGEIRIFVQFFHTFFDGAYNTRDMYFSVGDDGMQRPWLQPSEIHVLGLLF